MGAVCPGGTLPIEKKEKGLISEKSRNSFNKPPKEVLNSNSRENDYMETPHMFDSGELRRLSFSSELKPSKPSTPARRGSTKVKEKGSFLGIASTVVGLDRAVEALDALGSSMSNLNPGSAFVSGIASKGSRISILAFEVANTIVKGANLLYSLSEENIFFLKKEILHSEGVQLLVSTDTRELLMFAAADKREELEVFSREVVRFGDLCKDPQWHHLDRFFSRLDSDTDDLGQKQLREEAEATMQELNTLAQHTSELYHELHSLDRFEQDYKQRVEEVESLNLPCKGEGLTMLHSELKHQRKLVRTLKKKSLWSKNLEEIMEKLVDIVTFIHQEITDNFGDNGAKEHHRCPPQRLGAAGLALHYANVINLMDTIASRPAYLPPNMRDMLYSGLPPAVKKALRGSLHTNEEEQQLSIGKVKAEMEKTLQWLVPLATNTVKAHQGFGWVGEWANTGNEFGKSKPKTSKLVRLQTLYHANKQKTDSHILEMVTWLHRLFNLVRNRDHVIKVEPPLTTRRAGFLSKSHSMDFSIKPCKTKLSEEDQDMLNRVLRQKLVPGISKSQEFVPKNRVCAMSRSTGSSPNRELGSGPNTRDIGGGVWDIMDSPQF